MKSIYCLFIAVAFVFISCSGDETSEVEVFNAEAFAYDVGEFWEVNTTTRVKGFTQKEENNTFNASLSYNIDLVTPKGDTIKSLVSKVEDITENEEMSDTAIEVQFELDSTYEKGNYTVIFNVTDVNTNKSSSITAEFEIDQLPQQ